MLYNKQDIEAFIEKFTRQKLAKPDWTHEAHLITAIWFIINYEYADAVCRLKSGIILLNHSHKNDNTGSGGYHETITIFWTKIIAMYIQLTGEKVLENLVNNFISSPLSDRNLPARFYEKEELLAANLRAVYTPPGRKEFTVQVMRRILEADNNW